jgi:DNA (cytosine-5)-methyltransferase 1/DNA (cytosine-5)-methyltransferase 3A
MKKKIRKVVSLFNGMSCGYMALNEADIEFEEYYSSEIDSFANDISSKMFPNIIHMGDVTKWREWNIDWSEVDLILSGFPCQAWSVAGNNLGDKDPRGKLFWDMLDIIKYAKQANPSVSFLIENVKMRKAFESYITYHTEQALGYVSKYLIDSALFSAQRRLRYYWTNIKMDTTPIDKGIILQDILDNDVPEKYYLSQKAIDYMGRCRDGKERWEIYNNKLEGKAGTLCASMWKGVPYSCIKIERPRRITPKECMKLQTIPEKQIEVMLGSGTSDTQLYKMLGNGWTVDVIAYILKSIQ